MLELIFVLTLMGAFAACFAIRPFGSKAKDDVAYATKVALSELVFLARLQSMAGTPITLAVAVEDWDSLSGPSKLEIKKNYWEIKRSKYLHSRISNCKFVNFPMTCKSSDFPKNTFKAGEIQLNSVVFEEKNFSPFQLKFSLDDKEWYITVDTNAQTHIYKQEQ
ncbi:MAG: hypothetical protein LBI47_01840 [Puniceicoccales bacterium]|nr:hypothetical protein [Puniceicoccales bacterium]